MKTCEQLQNLAECFLKSEKFYTNFVEKIRTHFMFSPSFSENLTLSATTWKSMVETDRPQKTI